jgi:hypothetical protein
MINASIRRDSISSGKKEAWHTASAVCLPKLDRQSILDRARLSRSAFIYEETKGKVDSRFSDVTGYITKPRNIAQNIFYSVTKGLCNVM